MVDHFYTFPSPEYTEHIIYSSGILSCNLLTNYSIKSFKGENPITTETETNVSLIKWGKQTLSRRTAPTSTPTNIVGCD